MLTQSPLIESEASQLGRALNDTGLNTGPLAGILNGAKLHLGKTNIPITPETAYAALSGQEADYDGYAAVAIVWGTAVTANDNTVEVVSTTLTLTPTGDTADNSVYNLWVSNTGGTVWYLAGAIVGGPVPMGDVLDQIKVTLRFRPATQSLVVVLA